MFCTVLKACYTPTVSFLTVCPTRVFVCSPRPEYLHTLRVGIVGLDTLTLLLFGVCGALRLSLRGLGCIFELLCDRCSSF